jgi:SAM-dependent methyltransferase
MRLDPASAQRFPASAERFRGFADLYDANRPSPPAALGPLLACYANVERPAVVDIGSGTGLSSRWAATWAASVTAVEPNAEMRRVAESHPAAGVQYLAGLGHETGLHSGTADVVTVVQAMHWMNPDQTLAEVARILRPGGLLAVIDADWPPVAGVAAAEEAWRVLHGRIRVLEARVAAGERGEQLRRPITDDDPVLADDDLADPHRNRVMPGGLRSWSKSGHLDRMKRSGHFWYAREIALSERVPGEVERFCALMYSQGSYQGLRRLGLSDDEIGAAGFERQARSGFGGADSFAGLSFTWRVRIGVKRK